MYLVRGDYCEIIKTGERRYEASNDDVHTSSTPSTVSVNASVVSRVHFRFCLSRYTRMTALHATYVHMYIHLFIVKFPARSLFVNNAVVCTNTPGNNAAAT